MSKHLFRAAMLLSLLFLLALTALAAPEITVKEDGLFIERPQGNLVTVSEANGKMVEARYVSEEESVLVPYTDGLNILKTFSLDEQMRPTDKKHELSALIGNCTQQELSFPAEDVYVFGTLTLTEHADVSSLHIAKGAVVRIEDGASLSVSGDLIWDGMLYICEDGAFRLSESSGITANSTAILGGSGQINATEHQLSVFSQVIQLDEDTTDLYLTASDSPLSIERKLFALPMTLHTDAENCSAEFTQCGFMNGLTINGLTVTDGTVNSPSDTSYFAIRYRTEEDRHICSFFTNADTNLCITGEPLMDLELCGNADVSAITPATFKITLLCGELEKINCNIGTNVIHIAELAAYDLYGDNCGQIIPDEDAVRESVIYLNGRKLPYLMKWSEYTALTESEQNGYYAQFLNMKQFRAWRDRAQELEFVPTKEIGADGEIRIK